MGRRANVTNPKIGILRVWTVLSIAALSASIALAQSTGLPKPGGSGSGTGTGNTPTNPNAVPGNLPRNSPNSPNTLDPSIDGLTRGTMISGRVVMDDGTVPPGQVIIERICNSTPRPQAYTDLKGYFSFQVGNNEEMIGDASVSRISGPGFNTGSQNSSTRSLFACDIRAQLAGYRSDTISLANHRNLDDPNIGTIILHRMANVEGLTTSATSMLAPKDAKKAYEKGLEAVKKSKVDEAQADFSKATELYPKYAAAWYELGRVYEQREHAAEARNAYTKAVAADSKYINPYERMFMLDFKEQKWQEVADTTDRILRLNPYDFPSAYYYNAVANLQLEKLDMAEKSAREAMKLGTAKVNPKTNYVLGVILAKKEDFKGAAECFKAYLALGDVPDKEKVAKMLAAAEQDAEAKAVSKPDPER